ncbi:MAG TPA: TIGR03032 family protein [Gemmata sp.]|jgi:uncharacterized protein (TIGR03032 family)|nr:TIGR03032 family protein [Gemmata sp.]
MEQRDFHVTYSENLPSLLAELKSSLLISTYRTGNLVAVSQRGGRIVPSFHTFDRPMGIAIKKNGIAVGTRTQIWFMRSAPDIAAKLDPHGQYDASFLTRYSHFTGDIHCHDMTWIGSELWIVNTLFSCLCTLHPSYNFAPRWLPPFLSALAPEDRCHLNGLAAADGQPRFVSAMAETDTRQGWRVVKKTAGCLIDVASGETIVRGLTMPHSPRLSQGKLYVLHSGLGRLETVNPSNGHRTTVCELPGYTRGLAIAGSLAFVGLSKIRSASDWDGVPIARNPERLKCGVWVIDLNRGIVVGSFEFLSGADELFDVQLLPGVSSPFLSGPLEEHPVWTVMPSR